MEWLQQFIQPEVLALLIPVIAIVGAFSVAALKAHHKHLERIERIKQGYIPEIHKNREREKTRSS
jgi:hypothetical protein